MPVSINMSELTFEPAHLRARRGKRLEELLTAGLLPLLTQQPQELTEETWGQNDLPILQQAALSSFSLIPQCNILYPPLLSLPLSLTHTRTDGSCVFHH